MNTEKFKRVCRECGHHYNDFEKLVAIHPFDPNDTVSGCPKCLAVDAYEMVCDEPGCKKAVSAGFNTKDGYRWTCHEHSK